MTALTSIPYDWLRKLPRSLLEKDEIPLLSSPGPFPWDRLIAFLTKTFQLEKLEITVGNWETRTQTSVTQGLGSPLKYLNLEISPVEGVVTWAMAEKDIKVLMAIILTKEARASDLIDPEYIEGFLEFIAMETLLAFNRAEYDKGLVPHIIDTVSEPANSSLCLDITFNCNGTSFIGRLILSEDFRHSWKDRYTQHKMSVNLATDLAEKLQVLLHLEGGHTTLSSKEWAEVHPGDYVPLNSCTLEPGTDKGRVMITMNGQSLFRAKVKQGNIKILEFPLYQEVTTAMSNEHDDDDLDEYFDESEIEDESGEFHDDESFTEDDDDFEHDDHTQEHDDHTGEHETKDSSAPTNSAKENVAIPSGAAPHSSTVSPENIQLNIIVEVGRLQMSIQKLMELQPGNLLELDVHPESGVDLVVNGKCIARGELLRIGDTLGVRILDKG